MNKLLHLVINILVCSFILSCAREQTDILYPNPNFLFDSALTIRGEHLKENYLTPYSFKCFFTENGFLGAMPVPGKHLIHLADLTSGEILVSTLPKGRAAGEILTSVPHIDYYNDNLYVGDVITNRIKRISIINNTFLTEDLTTFKNDVATIMTEMCVVSDSLFIVFGYSHKSHNILLVNCDGNVIFSLPYPILNEEKINSSLVGNIDVSMKLTPCRNYLYICNKTYNHVRKYKISPTSVDFEVQYNLTTPNYRIRRGKPVQTEDNLFFSGEIFIGDEYIYLVANPEYYKDFKSRIKIAKSNNERPNFFSDRDTYILVFTHDFNFVRSYVCDGQFSWIVLTPDKSIVYAADNRCHGLKKYILEGCIN